MNEYDSNRIKDFTKKIGYLLTTKIDEANCFVLNTCHIREKATEKVYHEVGRVKKKFRNREKPIVLITGCVAQAEGDLLLTKEKYIDAVVGPQSYHNINNIVLAIENKKKIKLNYTDFDVVNKFDEINLNKNTDSKVSTFLTVQEGCDKFCKFCVVPYTRGPEHSRSLNEILNEAKQQVENGSKEIILLGQNVNAYRHDNKRLSDLLFALDKISGLQRIRYTTSHPKDLTQDLIEAHGNCKKLMPILHLPVQSGSSKMLKLMNRNHTIEEYLGLIEKLKIKKPTIKFSSDFIIAYPGETDKDFEKTVQLMKKVKFINSYSFIFSPRPGTPAANLKEVDSLIAKKRLANFQNISNDIKREYRNQLVNTTVNVLFENKVKDENKYFGRDEHFNSIIVESNKDLSRETMEVKINKCNQNTLFGEVTSVSKKVEYAA